MCIRDSFQEKCIGKMQEISTKSGRAILFVSHNVPTIRHLCSRVVWLKDGAVFTEGETRPITEKYLLEMMPKEDNKGRYHNDQFKLTLDFVEGQDGRQVDGLFFGQNYSLVCRLDCRLPSRRAHLLLEVVDINNEIISSICSREEGTPWFRLDQPNVFRAVLGPLQLFPGNYTLNALVFDADTGACLVDAHAVAPLRLSLIHI